MRISSPPPSVNQVGSNQNTDPTQQTFQQVMSLLQSLAQVVQQQQGQTPGAQPGAASNAVGGAGAAGAGAGAPGSIDPNQMLQALMNGLQQLQTAAQNGQISPQQANQLQTAFQSLQQNSGAQPTTPQTGFPQHDSYEGGKKVHGGHHHHHAKPATDPNDPTDPSAQS